MKLFASRTWSLMGVVIFCTGAVADEGQPASASETPSLLSSLHGKPWATLMSYQGGFQIRLLTDEEKTRAEKTIEQYRKVRGGENAEEEANRVATAYRSMPSDVRLGRFYKFRGLGPSAVELKDDQLHAILPVTAVRILLGPTGRFSMGGRSVRASTAPGAGPSPEDFIRALRGGRTGGFAGRAGSIGGNTGAVVGGLLGSVTAANGGRDEDKEPEAKLALFHLKYADATSVVNIVQEIYADLAMRIAVDQRTNAVIIYGDQKAIHEVESLIEALDMNVQRDE